MVNKTFMLLMLVLSMPISFAQITITKDVTQKNLNAGDKATIFLNINNDFDKDIIIKLEDSNIISNNGIIIKCLELNIPSKKTVRYDFDPISLNTPGEFNIGTAKATFNYNGKSETVISNEIKIRVGGQYSDDDTKAVTEIYKCGGVQSTSTQFASSSGNSNSQFSFSFGSGGNTLSFGNPIGNPSANPQVQQPQNTPQQQAMISQLLKIESLPEYIKAEQKLNDDGFILQDRRLSPLGNDTSFEYIFKNGDKIKTIEGNLNDGKINVKKQGKYLVLLVITILIIVAIIGAFVYLKRPGPLEEKVIIIPEKKIEVTLTQEIMEAKNIFESGNEAAFDMIAIGVKNHIKKELLIDDALTNKELLSKLDGKEKITCEKIFSICDQVRFARDYTKKDFEKIIKLTEDLL